MKKLAAGIFFLSLLVGCAHSGAVALPDLEIQDVEQIDDGAKVTLKNIGTGASSDFKLYFELDKDGKTVGEFTKKVNGLAAGEEKIIETSFSGTEYGLGYVKADSDNAISESNEENNEFGF